MDSKLNQPINLTLFDKLLLDFLFHEGVLKENPSPNSDSIESVKENKEKLATISKIRDLVKCGRITEAINLTNELAPDLLKSDARLLFKLHKQQFVELLRSGDVDGAIVYIRHIAPSALCAYSDAYYQFKRACLLLVYSKEQSISPVSNEWSLQERDSLAGLLYSTLVLYVGIQEPMFSLLMRYLVILHSHYHVLHDSVTEFPIIDQLTLPGGERASLADVNTTNTAKPEDRDVQLLVQTVQISRQQAVESLKRANCILVDALKNELSYMRLNVEVLIALVLEYCYYRGLVTVESLSLGKKQDFLKPLPLREEEKFAKLRKVRQLVSDGCTTEVLALATGLVPDFSAEAPRLFFHLRQCEFVDYVRKRDYDSAMEVARSCLGPMSVQYPELVQNVRDATVLLAFRDSLPKLPILDKARPYHISGPLYTVLGEHAGLQEPELLRVLRYLLNVHTLLFDTLGSSDPFAAFFQIEALKTADLPQMATRDSNKKARIEAVIVRQEPDEDTIMMLMEMLALPREEVVELLRQFDGNVENVIASSFG